MRLGGIAPLLADGRALASDLAWVFAGLALVAIVAGYALIGSVLALRAAKRDRAGAGPRLRRFFRLDALLALAALGVWIWGGFETGHWGGDAAKLWFAVVAFGGLAVACSRAR